MKNFEIRDRLAALVIEERRVSNEILDLLVAAMESRSWLEFGYSSLFDWLTRGFGYSPAKAMRRIEAARLLRAVPEAKDTLGISVLAKVQAAIRAQEKLEVVAQSQKVEAVKAVGGLSVPEAEKKLVELFPASGEKALREVRCAVDENTTRYSLNLNSQASANLTRAEELFSHKFPHATDAEIIAFALEFLLEKKDPSRRAAASAAEVKSKASARRQILKAGQCSFTDPNTGIQCTSRYQLQLDHIKPRALGGENQPENLRPLCRQHNLFEAERAYGKAKMEAYRWSG